MLVGGVSEPDDGAAAGTQSSSAAAPETPSQTSAEPSLSSSPSPTPPGPAETPATPIWSVEASLAGPPAAAGDVTLAYTLVADGAFALTAWDGAGAELWTLPAHPGNTAAGVQIVPMSWEVDGSTRTLLFSGPGDWNGAYALHEVDVATGEILANGPLVSGPDRPWVCPDEVSACATGWNWDEFAIWRYADGALTALSPTGDDMRRLGEDVYSTNLRPDAEDEARRGAETLLRFTEVGTLWERPYEDVFGAGASSDAGWHWRAYGDLLVGVGYVMPPEGEPRQLGGRMVGLDAATGNTLWTVDNANYCEPTEDLLVACVFESGTVQWPEGEDRWRSSTTSTHPGRASIPPPAPPCGPSRSMRRTSLPARSTAAVSQPKRDSS